MAPSAAARFYGFTNSRRTRASSRGATAPPREEQQEAPCLEIGDVVGGTVRSISEHGIFLDVGLAKNALLPASKMCGVVPCIGDRLDKLEVISVDKAHDKVTVSFLRSGKDAPRPEPDKVYFFVGGRGGLAMPSAAEAEPERRLGARRHSSKPAKTPARGTPLEDLQLRETVAGTVTGVSDFGIFIDIGAECAALLPRRYMPLEVEDPEVGDVLEELCIVEVDMERGRISLSVQQETPDGELQPLSDLLGKGAGGKGKRGKAVMDKRTPLKDLNPGDVVAGKVKNVAQFGVFIDIGAEKDGLLHQSIIPDGMEFEKGDEIEDLVIKSIEYGNQRMSLSFACMEIDPEYDRDLVPLRQSVAETMQERSRRRDNENDRDYDRDAVVLRKPIEESVKDQESAGFPGKGKMSEFGKGSSKGKRSRSLTGLKGEDTGAGKDRRSRSKGAGKDSRFDGMGAGRDLDRTLEGLDRRASLHASGDSRRPLSMIDVGTVVPGRVKSFGLVGAVIDFGCVVNGLLPKSFIEHANLTVGDVLDVRVTEIVEEVNRVTLALTSKSMDRLSQKRDDGHTSGKRHPSTPPTGKTADPVELAKVFPEPEEIPRMTRTELRGNRMDLPRPNRFTRRATTRAEGGTSDAEDEEKELIAELLPGLLHGNRRRKDVAEGEGDSEAAQPDTATAKLEGAQAPDDGESQVNASAPAKATEVPLPHRAALACPAMEKLCQEVAAGSCDAAQQLAKEVAASPHPVQACAAASAALRVLSRRDSCAVAALTGLLNLNEAVGRVSEPILIRNLPTLLERYGSRDRDLQLAAEDVAETLVARLNPYGVEHVLPSVLATLKQKEKTDIKVGALRLLSLMRDEDTVRPLARQLDKILPHIVDMLNDVKKEVREAASDTAKVLFECAQNKDLEPHLDKIIEAMMDQSAIPSIVNQLSETVFVQTVETQALSVVMPLIVRGLKHRDERTKRRALVIADNMCKLVPDVTEIQPFLPTLIPLVKKATQNISDPEVRAVATRCYATLETADKADRRTLITKRAVLRMMEEKISKEKQVTGEMTFDYVAALCACMSACRSFEYAEWWHCIAPYLTPHWLTTEECEDLVPDLLETCYDAAEGNDVEDIDEEGEDLCNCIFTLGYGSLTLLNNTRLHLKRGKCYGLCGPNDCGKSTLLRAINNEQVDGFPPKSELVTAFVEHGIGEKEPECEWTPLEYIFADETIQAMHISKKKVVAAMRSLGFDDQKLKTEIGHLSGGWKMKLGLVRAMLMCADILLLDEPTGHLDVANVAWLGEYILSLSKDKSRPVTTIVVSHDTGFLDKVCTHVINVKQRKLKTYKGNVTDFVRRCPEAKSYLTLTNEKQRFVLPEPGMLEGVKSKGKKLLKMHHVTYTYPGNDTPTLFDVSIEVSLLSRVAVIGPNGAGKSTMIKALVGELPVVGKAAIWKHPNVRISYVAQHAFHHVEQHLDQTATQYLLWRFAGGEDREALHYRAEDVNKEVKQYWLKDGWLLRCKDEKERAQAVRAELILGRKKSKVKQVGEEKYEYMVKWHGSSADNAMWVAREILIEMGELRLVQREDEKQAAAHGLVSRPLTQPQVEEHLAGFGLDSSLASHTRLGILSGGQKVKVVLGAAMWLSPHILILDEPTNYLDRESLGALAAGLKEFGGGVIVISHNREFCHAVCDERWVMDAGHLTREGDMNKKDEKYEIKEMADDYTDEFGNVHKIKKKMPTTDKELKKIKRQKELAKKRGDVFVEDDEDEWWDKLQADADNRPQEQDEKGKGGHETVDQSMQYQ
eukprot:TRINITY_DN24051_c0_g3_i1.p1 TRINITY_DN24051_c0_g3~~TRINITY_DN24051_c0_g3_i1.p1  ORF type:complete len:1800 (-),score=405.11 TRINITY_DN24051_c0_g3_i1:238-5571(-)